MSNYKVFLSWVVGACFLISLSGIVYFYYTYQIENNVQSHEHSRQVMDRILDMQKKLEANGSIASEILNSNHELLKRLDTGLANHTLEMKAHRKFNIESHENIHNEIESVFERLNSVFEKNRELHRATQRFLKVPQEDK